MFTFGKSIFIARNLRKNLKEKRMRENKNLSASSALASSSSLTDDVAFDAFVKKIEIHYTNIVFMIHT